MHEMYLGQLCYGVQTIDMFGNHLFIVKLRV